MRRRAPSTLFSIREITRSVTLPIPPESGCAKRMPPFLMSKKWGRFKLGNGGQLKGQSITLVMLELPGWGWQALGLIDGNEALAIFGLGQFLLGYVYAQDAVFELSGNVVFRNIVANVEAAAA